MRISVTPHIDERGVILSLDPHIITDLFPTEVFWNERQWIRKPEFHVTLVNSFSYLASIVKDKQRLSVEEAKQKVSMAVTEAISETVFSVIPLPHLLAVKKPYLARPSTPAHIRETLVLMCALEGGEDFLARLQSLLDLPLKPLAPHVTLYTRDDEWSRQGIGLFNFSDIAQYGKEIEISSLPTLLATSLITFADQKSPAFENPMPQHLPAFHYSKIATPTRPQIDTLVAVFILKEFGEGRFPGIKDAAVETWAVVPPGETEVSLNEQGVVLIDLGRGRFDHHDLMPQTTASDLIAQHLGVHEDPALAKLLEFARRDDFYGKGIISDDALDRAFGLPGLLVNLNKDNQEDPNKVVNTVLPLLLAHYHEESRRTKEMPEEFARLTESGAATTLTVRQRDKNLKVVIVSSDNTSLAGFLRSQLGGRFDIVAQQFSSGHLNILSRPVKRPDLRKLAGELRRAEARHLGIQLPTDFRYLNQAGRIRELPMWYYDQATNSIQNGGANPKNTAPTKIVLSEVPGLLTTGLQISVQERPSFGR